MADRTITVTNPSVVTNDTLVGYNNYSDIDGQLGTIMTPTEATNGKTITLSDGAIHQVTTKPVGTTNGEFSAVVSEAVTVNLSSLILFQDDFAGTDTDPLKWDVTNLNGGVEDKILLSQNDEFLFYCNNTGTLTEIGDDALISVDGFDMLSGIRVFTFDINSNSQNDSTWYFGIADSTEPLSTTNNRITLGRTATVGDIKLITRIGGVTVEEEPTFDLSVTTTVKIIIDGSSVTFSYWTGSVWSVWTTNTEFTTTNTWNIVGVYRTASGIGASVGDQFMIDNVYVTDADFTTQYPS